MAATKPPEHASSAQTPRSHTQRPSEQLLDERGASTPNMGSSAWCSSSSRGKGRRSTGYGRAGGDEWGGR
eukprot:scaffold28007_cov48-Phaeocystis_antarctica.AAC.1